MATIAYEGTHYVGWETQSNGLAVQEVIEEALATLCRHPVPIEGSGRTDAGVHAWGQVASFGFDRPMTLDKLQLALNGMTPPDVGIRSVREVHPEFHARFSATSKRYRYTILNERAPRPLVRHHVHHDPRPIDLAAMQAAAARLEGTHDFRAFAREGHRRDDGVRTVTSVDVRREDGMLTLDVTGTGFLYNMVRIITGTLFEVGLGRRSVEEVAALLETTDRRRAGFTAPAHGLMLMEVHYPEHLLSPPEA